MKTREEVDELKRQWRNDPCWDLGDEDGFEEYWGELNQYRRDCEMMWKEQELRRKHLRADALGIPGNFALLAHIETLERKIKALQEYNEAEERREELQEAMKRRR